ncbi:MAG: hypothetical protein MK108_14590 [Mariniblastus sp.]|nr:hypothetical protein [Mariniblastus sp.]
MKQHVTTWMAFGLGLSLMTGCSNEFFQNANGGSSLNPTSDTAGCGGGC